MNGIGWIGYIKLVFGTVRRGIVLREVGDRGGTEEVGFGE